MSGVPNRAPSQCWTLRWSPYSGYVATAPDERILLALPHDPDSTELIGIEVSRKDARLLAKRINECLDRTVHR